jgi:dipeptidyl-peptidase-4
MKKMRISLMFLMISTLTAQWQDLSLGDVFKKSPFEFASLGQWKWSPDTDEYLFFKMDTTTKVRSLYNYNLVTGDTSLFLIGDKFAYDSENLKIVDYTINTKNYKILLVTDQQRIWRHSRSAIYYLYDMNNGSVKQVADGNRLRNVKFSPDGRSIAYVNNDNNLYVFHIDKNKEIRLTKDGSFNIINGHFGWVYEEEFGSYDAYRWSPNSKFIAFVREDQTYVKQFPMIDELQLYPKIYWHHYPKVGETNPVLNIGIVNVNTRRTKWLDLNSTEEMYFPRMKWLKSQQTASGNQELVVTKINRHQNRLELLRYDVKKGKGKVFWKDESEAWVSLTDDLFFLKDGSFITLSERSGYQHIYHYDKNGMLINTVTNGDWDVSWITAFDEEKKIVYLNGKKDSVIESNLYSVKLDGSDFKLLSENLGSHRARFSPSNSYYIDSYSTTNSPLAITLHNSDGSKVRDLAITDTGQFEEYGFQETKFIQIPTSDNGTLLNAKITLPRDFDLNKKYPVIVYGYSGPGSQTVINRQGRGLWDRYLNQEGYITFSIDPRGTGGRGTEFKYLSYKDISKWVVTDQVEGAKYLNSLPYVDGNRIGIWGWSGGGYMTALCMTKGAPYFKVGVAVAGNYDLKLYDTIWTERYMGLLDENAEGYKNASVFTYADMLEGKLLVIHGTNDDNVHTQHATQLMEEFVKADKQADYFTYANRNHRIRGGNTTFHLWTKITNYFMDNL